MRIVKLSLLISAAERVIEDDKGVNVSSRMKKTEKLNSVRCCHQTRSLLESACIERVSRVIADFSSAENAHFLVEDI